MLNEMMAGVKNPMEGLFGQIAPGMCRISMDSGIAIKTSSGYKTYNIKTGQMTNCDNFAFNIGEEFFFTMPATEFFPGDIILVNRKPMCVIEAKENEITAIDYEQSERKTIIPERHMLWGNMVMYGKLVSIFGDNLFLNGGNNMQGIFQMMMQMQMMKMLMGGFKFGGNNDMGSLGTMFMFNSMFNNQNNPMMNIFSNIGNMFKGCAFGMNRQNNQNQNQEGENK